MFGGLFSARLRAAQRALREGRLDDCLRLVLDPDIAEADRDGRLRGDLAGALLARAREHFRAERFAEALLDLSRAEQCGLTPSSPQVGELRGQVLTVAEEVARQDAQRRRLLEEAQQRIHAGSLRGGQRVLSRAAADDPAVQALRLDAARREQEAATLLERAEAAFAQHRLDAAVADLERAARIHAHAERVVQLERRIAETVLATARQFFDTGRLRAAGQEMKRLRSLAISDPLRRELAELLEVTASASAALAAGDYGLARQRVHRLRDLASKARWVAEAADQLGKLDAALLALRGGPLGEGVGERSAPKAIPRSEPSVTMPVVAAVPPADTLPRQLLLVVEGGRSFLLHRDTRVSLGRAGEGGADVPLLADLSARHAEIVRVEEDYFLMANQPVEVDGMVVRQRLLRDGDRLTLARRAKLIFRMPSRRSLSARLELSDSTRMQHDVRNVILLRDTALLGRGPNCHMTHTGGGDLLLFERAGGLWVRVQDGRGSEAAPIELGKTMEIGGVSFSLQPWRA